jgi:hypothetical protein
MIGDILRQICLGRKTEIRPVVVPVAMVAIELGGGGGGGTRKPAAEIARMFGGGGGGLKVVARPVGLIHEQEGDVVFTRIEADKRSVRRRRWRSASSAPSRRSRGQRRRAPRSTSPDRRRRLRGYAFSEGRRPRQRPAR